MQLVVRVQDSNSVENAIALLMENFLYLNSHNNPTENLKPQYKPAIIINQNYPSKN